MMKKLLSGLLAVLMIFLITACSQEDKTDKNEITGYSSLSSIPFEVSFDYEEESSQEEVQASSDKMEENEIYYVLNTNTKKVHLPSCRSAKSISEKNYAITSDLGSALNDGYEKCKNCNPS